MEWIGLKWIEMDWIGCRVCLGRWREVLVAFSVADGRCQWSVECECVPVRKSYLWTTGLSVEVSHAHAMMSRPVQCVESEHEYLRW